MLLTRRSAFAYNGAMRQTRKIGLDTRRIQRRTRKIERFLATVGERWKVALLIGAALVMFVYWATQ